MQKLAITAIAASLAFVTPAFADDAHHDVKSQEANAVPAKPAANTAPTVQEMQDNVKKMQAQLDRIARAETDEERQKVIAEHMQTMQENIKLTRGMMAGMMDCPMMEGGMMMGKSGMGMMGAGASPGGSSECMRQMEKRMDMMQMMTQGAPEK